jgi:hypothetical protein
VADVQLDMSSLDAYQWIEPCSSHTSRTSAEAGRHTTCECGWNSGQGKRLRPDVLGSSRRAGTAAGWCSTWRAPGGLSTMPHRGPPHTQWGALSSQSRPASIASWRTSTGVSGSAASRRAHGYLLAVPEISGADEKRMRLRYPGSCRVCDVALPAKTEAIYERETKTVRCVTHGDLDRLTPVASEVDPARATDAEAAAVGVPGASARREFERRRLRREERIRSAHPKIGGLIHALTDEPQSTKGLERGRRRRRAARATSQRPR